MLCNALSCQKSYLHLYKMQLIHEHKTRLLFSLFFHVNSKHLELVIIIWLVQINNLLLKPPY